MNSYDTIKKFDNIVRLKECRYWERTDCILAWPDVPYYRIRHYGYRDITPLDLVHFIGSRN